jgi:hypothetical protein
MLWAIPSTLVAAYLWFRLRRVERGLRALSATTHDAANRAMRRHRRDRWRWRETEHALNVVAREAAPGFVVPPIADGPPNDPDSVE